VQAKVITGIVHHATITTGIPLYKIWGYSFTRFLHLLIIPSFFFLLKKLNINNSKYFINFKKLLFSLKMTIPIYCVNMVKHADRKEAILNQAKKLNLDINFFNAIDGTLLPKSKKFTCCRSHPYRGSYHHPDKEYVNLLIMKQFHLFNSNLTIGEVGLAVSLIILFKQLIKENVEWAIIIEDDVQFDPDFLEHLKILDADTIFLKQNNVDFVYLNDRTYCEFNAPAQDVLLEKYYPVKSGFGFDCYLISKTGMEKLCDLYNPLIYPVDLQIVPHLQKYEPKYIERNYLKMNFVINGYKYHKNLAKHTDARSTIHGFCPHHN